MSKQKLIVILLLITAVCFGSNFYSLKDRIGHTYDEVFYYVSDLMDNLNQRIIDNEKRLKKLEEKLLDLGEAKRWVKRN